MPRPAATPPLARATALLLAATACAAVQAAPPVPRFTGPDFSGTYDCTGQDHQEGPYTGTVTLALVREQSTGVHGAYRFTLEVPGYGTYRGQAATRGRQMAVHFGLDDPKTQDYGTGIAEFSRTPAGAWRFRKYYYEPAFKGGNFGTEDCTRR